MTVRSWGLAAVLAACLLPPLTLAQSSAATDALDEADRLEFNAKIERAQSCKVARDFVCAANALSQASKFANGSRDRATLKAVTESVEYAKLNSVHDDARQKYAAERSAVERNAEHSAAEASRIAERSRADSARNSRIGRQEERAQNAADQQEAQASRAALAAQLQRTANDTAAVLNRANRDTANAMAESRRVQAAQAQERENARIEREKDAAERRVQVAAARDQRLQADTARMESNHRELQRKEEEAKAEKAKTEKAALENRKKEERQMADQKARDDRAEKEKARLAAREQDKAAEDKQKTDYYAAMKSGIRLVATRCPDGEGHFYATGVLPKQRPKGSYCIDVGFEASCQQSNHVTKHVADNFIGMSGCFGDTYKLLPKPACEPNQVTLRVTDVVACGR